MPQSAVREGQVQVQVLGNTAETQVMQPQDEGVNEGQGLRGQYGRLQGQAQV